jgi:hypothetical protein
MRFLIAALIALIPPAWIALFVIPRVINVPIYDEWLWAPLAIKAFDGTLVAGDLWAQQNAHRSVVPTAIAMALVRLTHWDVRMEIAVSLLAAAATVAILVSILPPSRRTLGLPVFSFLVFGPAQIENWTWGFQLSWFLVNLGAVAAVAALSRDTWTRTLLAASAALVSSLSLLSGFAVWVGAILLALLGRAAPARVVGLAIAGAVTAGVFLIGYHIASNERADLASGGWTALPAAVPVLLGAPIVANLGVIACGIVGIAALAGAFALARAGGASARPWIALIAIALVAAAEIAVARAGGGVDEMLTSRYVTIGTLFWVGVAGLVLRAPAVVGTRRLALAVPVALAVIGWTGTSIVGALSLDGFIALQRDEAEQVDALAAGRSGDIAHYVPDPHAAAAIIPSMRRERLGPFR